MGVGVGAVYGGGMEWGWERRMTTCRKQNTIVVVSAHSCTIIIVLLGVFFRTIPLLSGLETGGA